MAFLNNEVDFSSSSTRQWNYDVFLSFRGEDTREGFTSHLYEALCHKGIYTFIDDKLPRGEEISEELIQAIKNSSILVIVFSKNYAESKWCLDELVEIVQCREEDKGVKIRPVFYNVDPSEIRNQKGNFEKALAKHEEKLKDNKNKVQRWRDALRTAANASGWHYKKGEVVRQQAPDILEKRSRLCSYKDSLEVLTRNKGSKKIRGIMLHSPKPVKVQLHTEAFKKMENLKFLIVENVHICKPLEFLPHSLIFLKWPNYPFNLPSEYIPKKLVAIEMPHSHIRLPKQIKQELWLENLIDVNLSYCKFITKLPKLKAPNLENLNLSFCENLVEFSKLQAPNLVNLDLILCENLVEFPKLQAPNLKNLNLSHCKNLVEFPKLWAPNLENLYFFCCENLVKLPKLWDPNLEYLNLSYCENLVEIDECFGSLEKLKTWNLRCCGKLQILPSQLRLKSLHMFDLSGCSRLERLPKFHPEMECLKILDLSGSGIRELPSSIEHLTGLCILSLYNGKTLWDLPNSPYKLRRLQELSIPTAKLRPISGYGFVNMKELSFRGYKSIIELDLLMKPDYFPALERIDLSYTNIVTIPESISRLEKLSITNCKLLREIQGLPQSISQVFAENCMLLDIQSPSGLLNQVVEMIWILSNRVCGSGRARSHKLMDPQLTNYFASETEGAESEDGDISMDTQFFNRTILVDGTEVAKWFHHQSVDNSIFFFVGRKFPKFAVCIVPAQEGCSCSVYTSINGKRPNYFPPILGSVQRQLNESNPTDQNLVEISLRVNCASTSQM